MFVPPRNEWRQFWSDFFDAYIVTNDQGVDSICRKGNIRIPISLYNFSFILIYLPLPQSLRNFFFLLLVICGIEPHPGPGLPELNESEQNVLTGLLGLTDDGFSRVITAVMSSSSRNKKQIITNTGSHRSRTSIPKSKKEWDLIMAKCYRFCFVRHFNYYILVELWMFKKCFGVRGVLRNSFGVIRSHMEAFFEK